MKYKTIILLSAKRSGSTAFFNVFRKHPQTKICHEDQNIENYEIQFWIKALKAIKNNPRDLYRLLKNSFPSFRFKQKQKRLNKKEVFKIWNSILRRYGPILFDKSPQYLNSNDVLDLILDYKNKGNNVKFFSIIRDPRDTITSQHELWKEYTREDSLKQRENKWLTQYQNLKYLRKKTEIPLYKYEEVAKYPKKYFKKIFKFCGIKYYAKSFSDFKEVSINRYFLSYFVTVKKWKWGKKIQKYLEEFNYDKVGNFNQIEKLLFNLRSFKRFIPLKVKTISKKFIM